MWSAQVYVLKSVDFKEKHSFVSNFLSFGEKKQIRLKLLNSICVNFCHPKWKQRKVIELNFYWKHKNHFSIKMQIKSKKKTQCQTKMNGTMQNIHEKWCKNPFDIKYRLNHAYTHIPKRIEHHIHIFFHTLCRTLYCEFWSICDLIAIFNPWLIMQTHTNFHILMFTEWWRKISEREKNALRNHIHEMAAAKREIAAHKWERMWMSCT